jgi:hypothetical protein
VERRASGEELMNLEESISWYIYSRREWSRGLGTALEGVLSKKGAFGEAGA